MVVRRFLRHTDYIPGHQRKCRSESRTPVGKFAIPLTHGAVVLPFREKRPKKLENLELPGFIHFHPGSYTL